MGVKVGWGAPGVGAAVAGCPVGAAVAVSRAEAAAAVSVAGLVVGIDAINVFMALLRASAVCTAGGRVGEGVDGGGVVVGAPAIEAQLIVVISSTMRGSAPRI